MLPVAFEARDDVRAAGVEDTATSSGMPSFISCKAVSGIFLRGGVGLNQRLEVPDRLGLDGRPRRNAGRRLRRGLLRVRGWAGDRHLAGRKQ